MRNDVGVCILHGILTPKSDHKKIFLFENFLWKFFGCANIENLIKIIKRNNIFFAFLKAFVVDIYQKAINIFLCKWWSQLSTYVGCNRCRGLHNRNQCRVSSSIGVTISVVFIWENQCKPPNFYSKQCWNPAQFKASHRLIIWIRFRRSCKSGSGLQSLDPVHSVQDPVPNPKA